MTASSKIYSLFGVLLLVICAGGAGIAHAATPLTITTVENIGFSAPSTTLTITVGSLADKLVIATSSVAVTLSSSTGGSFILLSPSYDLSVATSSGGGVVNISCSLGEESAALSQTTGSTIYTITTAGTTCADSAPPSFLSISTSGITSSGAVVSWTTNVAATTTIEYGTDTTYGSTVNDTNLTNGDSVTLSGLSSGTTYHFAIIAYANGTSTLSGDNTFTTSASSGGGGGGGSSGGGGGGGGGGSSSTLLPVSTSAGSVTSCSDSVPCLESLLAQLEAELNVLLKEAAAQGITVSGGASSIFTRNLTLGDRGTDVTSLQNILIQASTGPVAASLAKVGATGYFGSLTQQALAEYQASHGIAPASGYFGPKTRAYLEGGSVPVPVVTPTTTTAPAPIQSQPSSPSTSLSFGDTGTGVSAIQNDLVSQGYLTQGVFTQGSFDAATLRAVETFQCAEGIVCTGGYGYGVVGPKTRTTLGN